MNKNKGFTIIELLIVITIIALLAAVISIVFKSAKDRGTDTSVLNGLNQVRIQADLYYNFNGSYLNVCSSSKDNSTPKGINAMVFNSGKETGQIVGVNVNGAGSGEVRCNDTTAGWAAQAPLSDGKFYCVDYKRNGIITSTSIGNVYAYCQ